MAEAKKRLYLVKIGDKESLVNARTPAGALRTGLMHAGGSARYAEQLDIARLIAGGAVIVEEDSNPQGDLPLVDEKTGQV